MARPYYCEVEYLEGTGTQYINTGLYGNLNTEAELCVYASPEGQHYALLGDFTNTSKAVTLPFNSTSGSGLYSRFGDKSITSGLVQTAVKHIFKINKTGVYIDGVLKGSFNTTTAFTTQSTMYLFKFNGLDRNYLVGKMYYAKIWDNDNLVRDFVPVLDNSRVPCLYDRVTGGLFYNQGTGSFTAGTQIIPVEYIESSGTQYINTGFTPNQDTKVELTYQISNDLSSGFPLFGSRVSASSRGYSYQRYGAGSMGGQYGDNVIYSSVAPDLNKHTVIRDKNKIYLDGAIILSNTASTFTCPGNLYLNAMNNNGTAAIQNCGVKYYSMGIWDNGTKIRNYIPAIDEDNNGFLFDTLSHTIYGNAGTGSFSYGQVIKYSEPSKTLLRKKLALMMALRKKRKYYCEVEYLQFTGTQTIDTGIREDSVTCFLNVQATSTSGTQVLLCNNTTGVRAKWFGISSGNWGISGASANTPLPTTRSEIVVSFSDFYQSTTTSSFYFKDDPSNVYSNAMTQLATPTFTNLTLNGIPGSFPSYIKVYGFKVYNGSNVLLRDFIPVLDWDYVPCMYDKVSGQLFYNQGTGDFSYGREIHYVDYLESSGTQYIDTEYVLSSDCRGEALAEYTGVPSSGSSYIFGTFGGNKNFGVNTSLHLPGQDKLFYFVWANVARVDVTGDPLPALNTKYHVTVSRTLMKVNNSSITYNGATFTGSNPAYLFWANGTSQPKSIMKLYWTKFWQNNVLVRDYLPAIDENGVGFMFDRVTHTIFDNAGTGAFKYPAREIEYIESTGTQYLNTGWSPGANAGQFTFEVEVNCTQNSSGHGAIGSRSVDAGRNWVITNISTSGGTYQQFGYGSTYQNVVASTSNKWTTMKTYILGNAYVFETTVDGVTYSEYTPVQSFTNTANVYLMGINNKGSLFSSFPFIGKLRRAKLYDRGTLVKDYKPAFKNGYFGLWDAVNDYLPGITGTVTHGKIVEPKYE